MKWLLTFLAGVLLGAAGLFVFLRQVPHDAPVAPVVAVVSAPAANAAGAAATPTDPMAAALPPAPVVSTDLTEADLPLRPTQQEIPMPSDVANEGAAKSSAKLMIPVEGIKLGQLSDNFDQPRGKERHHEALDIMAPKGTRVIAVADGKVVKLFNSKPGGLTVYQFDPTEKYAYYYAHLDRYADGVKEGSVLKRGDLVGYVGVTGNSDQKAPHLHFAVVELTPKKEWWKGTSVNPYPMMGN
ncbi:M23 family metallopeptidase [Massilia sp. TWR1-2-2]|uniref:M23 family metallopeptidase n=1 Tax=Massilia sp. TWR1-2-2 TaxID=2804584 RepID=UPI003CF6E1AC